MLQASAETLRDSNLLREVHEWEKAASNVDRDVGWEGRAVAREIMAGVAVDEPNSDCSISWRDRELLRLIWEITGPERYAKLRRGHSLTIWRELSKRVRNVTIDIV